MKLIQRVGYYLGGFSVGLIVLAFFLSGKKTSCSYGPNARVLKNISTKTLVYPDNITKLITKHQLDSLVIPKVLNHGNVNFSKSNTKLKQCKQYVIEDDHNDKHITLTVDNCEDRAIIKQITVN